MYVNAEQQKRELMQENIYQGPPFKVHDDPRITKVGKILRKYSVDEFPQGRPYHNRASLKCLSIKEIMKLNNVELKLVDFMHFLEVENERYDPVFASGALYHMEKPIELLHKISKLSDRIFIWTQYYDYHVLSKRPDFTRKFQPLSEIEHEGHIYECATQSYGEALGWAGFCGGPESVSKWLKK